VPGFKHFLQFVGQVAHGLVLLAIFPKVPSGHGFLQVFATESKKLGVLHTQTLETGVKLKDVVSHDVQEPSV
jgi:hypothetical protein